MRLPLYIAKRAQNRQKAEPNALGGNDTQSVYKGYLKAGLQPALMCTYTHAAYTQPGGFVHVWEVNPPLAITAYMRPGQNSNAF